MNIIRKDNTMCSPRFGQTTSCLSVNQNNMDMSEFIFRQQTPTPALNICTTTRVRMIKGGNNFPILVFVGSNRELGCGNWCCLRINRNPSWPAQQWIPRVKPSMRKPALKNLFEKLWTVTLDKIYRWKVLRGLGQGEMFRSCPQMPKTKLDITTQNKSSPHVPSWQLATPNKNVWPPPLQTSD